MPTASAVVADLVDVALGRAGITFHAMKTFSGGRENIPDRRYFKDQNTLLSPVFCCR